MNYPHIAARLFSRPQMLHEGKLQAIMAWLSPRMGMDAPPRIAEMEVEHASTGQSEKQEGQIAVIDVGGTLVNRGAHSDGYSGLTSYEWLSRAVGWAAGKSEIKAILLRFDSYGGEVSGAFDCADVIASAAGKKPVWALVDDNCYSAAYLLASQCSRILTTRTGGCGSIGVIAVHVDQSKYDEKMGVKYTPVYAGSHKNDFSPHQPLADEPLAWLRKEVAQDYDLFCEYVSRGRGNLDARSTEAALYTGEAAVTAGLADGLASRSEALAMLTEQILKIGGSAANISTQGGLMATQAAAESPKRQAAEYCEDCPCKGGTAEAKAAGATGERARIAAILSLPECEGREKLAQQIAFETDMSSAAAQKLLNASPKAGATANPLAAAMASEQNPNVGVSGNAANEDEQSLVSRILSAGSAPQKGVN